MGIKELVDSHEHTLGASLERKVDFFCGDRPCNVRANQNMFNWDYEVSPETDRAYMLSVVEDLLRKGEHGHDSCSGLQFRDCYKHFRQITYTVQETREEEGDKVELNAVKVFEV